jgi:hypothetical protein
MHLAAKVQAFLIDRQARALSSRRSKASVLPLLLWCPQTMKRKRVLP